MEFSSNPFEIKLLSDDGLVEGLASTFGNVDQMGDVIKRGAFKDSLEAHAAAGTLPAMLRDHDVRQPVGRWLSFEESAAGLIAKGRLAVNSGAGREMHELLKAKAYTGLSIGFRPIRSTPTPRGKGYRLVEKIELFEVSFVTFPANRLARVTNVKSLASPGDIESLLRDAGMSGRKARTAASAAWAALNPKTGEGRRADRLASIVAEHSANLTKIMKGQNDG